MNNSDMHKIDKRGPFIIGGIIALSLLCLFLLFNTAIAGGGVTLNPLSWPGKALADINGDGLADLVSWNGPTDGVYVIPSDGTGRFDWSENGYTKKGLFNWRWHELADVNGDGMADLVTWNDPRHGLSIFPADGYGGFDFNARWYSDKGPFKWGWRELADVNGDGMMDLVTWCDSRHGLYVIPADGQGRFDFDARWYSDKPPFKMDRRALADVNGDGAADLVTWNERERGIYVIPADGNGGFDFNRRWYSNESPLKWSTRMLADVNGDGRADLITYSDPARGFYVVPADGYGGFDFNARVYTKRGLFKWKWRRLVDVNGDNMADLILWNDPGHGVYVIPADGRGGFDFDNRWYSDKDPFKFERRELADVNGDGMADLVTWSAQRDGVYVMLANGHRGFDFNYECYKKKQLKMDLFD